ncbi:MAG: hypothetical protein QOJ42_3583 [Acidobacteriaceae bacterium]|jgi:hypothetical protein|nr:hypothetical protein [Acidobacteriaceae bacterium]
MQELSGVSEARAPPVWSSSACRASRSASPDFPSSIRASGSSMSSDLSTLLKCKSCWNEMDACRRHSSGRTSDLGSDSKPHTDDRRKLQALDPTSHSDRAGSQRQQPSSGLDRSRRSGTGQSRDWARMTPDTTNNSETSRQIAIKATPLRARASPGEPRPHGAALLVRRGDCGGLGRDSRQMACGSMTSCSAWRRMLAQPAATSAASV